jgi:hypothetical protein
MPEEEQEDKEMRARIAKIPIIEKVRNITFYLQKAGIPFILDDIRHQIIMGDWVADWV